VTIHEEKWAYCPIGASTGHEWHAVGPMTLADVQRELAKR
jgi:hypothetical protein